MSYQKVNSRLLIRPRAIPKESFQSYLIRLARENGYKYKAFSSGITANSKPHRSFKPEDRTDIQFLISNIADNNARNLVDVWECGFYFKHLFDYSRIKICPKCYTNEKVLPPYWWLKNYLICDEHQLLLIDSCGNCNTRFNEDSIAYGHCMECGLEIEHNKSAELNSGMFDKKLHSVCAAEEMNTSRFRELISNEVEQIYVHYQICSYLLKEVLNRDKYINHRRTLDIYSLYTEQKEIQSIVKNDALGQLMYEALCSYRARGGKGVSSLINPIFKLIMSHQGHLYRATLVKLLIEEPKDLADWAIGLNWLEKLLSIDANNLRNFVKEYSPNLEEKSQGPFAVLIRDLNLVMSEYSKHSATFELPR
ncbi:hypothetical protein tloyanaT_05570 [Thalassotalea loyana]|uniref:TniQ domain-containing protein n=1 Tax=Thalassotalea loyana TaxID=280483 RepID=A0ABQ6HAH6_9GAMM|nr:TniQ family protein [Thalassotalea loyana]GLX84305.1 hypothetical protein tloyanaT_05570 [Thalassotalea loyana]